MKKILLLFIFCSISLLSLFSQSNILSTNALAEQVMLGNYNPADFAAAHTVSHPDSLVKILQEQVSPDSLKSLLLKIVSFQNRNTGSDTVSTTRGIGAARRWAYRYFQNLSARRDGRLLSSYLQFDRNVCTMSQHRNVFAVLPGTDSASSGIILIEAHMDSRCDDPCGLNCRAEGAEDNATGTALVMELARVMSQFSLEHTLVFMLTTGEEQGLVGADAFAKFANGRIAIKAVLNNDVIGGIICGETSSPPSCPGLNLVDSTQVRLFSSGAFNSPHKSLCRYIKLQYKEELLPKVQVPMRITLMSAEDRTGRGGDHIPFREQGFTAMRFTSSHEHGDASNDPGYTDRQHTSTDILGIDTNNDQILDSFFVDLNYLARNARINGTAASMLAQGPEPPLDFVIRDAGSGKLVVGIADPGQTRRYRVGVRTQTHDWDSVYTYAGILVDTIEVQTTGTYMVSVSIYDSLGIESLFTEEKMYSISTGLVDVKKERGFRLLQNRPNPFDESTTLSVWVDEIPTYQEAWIEVTDLSGKLVQRLPVSLSPGANEVLYQHGYQSVGIYQYTLYIDGKPMDSKKMVFAN